MSNEPLLWRCQKCLKIVPDKPVHIGSINVCYRCAGHYKRQNPHLSLVIPQPEKTAKPHRSTHLKQAVAAQKMLKMHQNGCRIAQIAYTLGYQPSTVKNYLSRQHAFMHQRGYCHGVYKVPDEVILAEMKKGISIQQIARNVGMSYAPVYARIRKLCPNYRRFE